MFEAGSDVFYKLFEVIGVEVYIGIGYLAGHPATAEHIENFFPTAVDQFFIGLTVFGRKPAGNLLLYLIPSGAIICLPLPTSSSPR
jgi:hypothetical protein